MLIRFWCDSEITFSRALHKNLVTVLYFSIIKGVVNCQNSRDKGPPEGNSARG